MLILTKEEHKWLETHGDRGYKDVLEDKQGKYVLMRDGMGGDEKVYIGWARKKKKTVLPTLENWPWKHLDEKA